MPIWLPKLLQFTFQYLYLHLYFSTFITYIEYCIVMLAGSCILGYQEAGSGGGLPGGWQGIHRRVPHLEQAMAAFLGSWKCPLHQGRNTSPSSHNPM